MLLEGKVVLITGAGRGQGRSHAIRAAQEGASIVALDIGEGEVRSPDYPTSSRDDLLLTEKLVSETGRECLTAEADVRDYAALVDVVEQARNRFGRLDGVVANAGIGDKFVPTWEIEAANWQTMLDVNLTGVFNTCKATIPTMREYGNGGSLVLISSVAGIKPIPYFAHYTVAKAGVRSLSLTLANELGPDGIRCNSIHPGAIESPMTDAISELSGVPRSEFLDMFRENQTIAEIMQPRDTSAAVVWLLSDESRFVTGLEMCVDAGETKK